jgi:hypothetical protein
MSGSSAKLPGSRQLQHAARAPGHGAHVLGAQHRVPLLQHHLRQPPLGAGLGVPAPHLRVAAQQGPRASAGAAPGGRAAAWAACQPGARPASPLRLCSAAWRPPRAHLEVCDAGRLLRGQRRRAGQPVQVPPDAVLPLPGAERQQLLRAGQGASGAGLLSAGAARGRSRRALQGARGTAAQPPAGAAAPWPAPYPVLLRRQAGVPAPGGLETGHLVAWPHALLLLLPMLFAAPLLQLRRAALPGRRRGSLRRRWGG